MQQREAILDAAEVCFLRDGVENARVEDIAGECGVSVGALYRYFPSRDDIIAAAGERNLQRDRDAMTELYQQELPLHGYLYESLRYFLARPSTVVETEAAARARESGTRGFEEWLTWLTARYERLQEAGFVRRDIPADQVARQLMVTYEGVAVMVSIGRTPDPEALVDSLARVLADGLAPPVERA